MTDVTSEVPTVADLLDGAAERHGSRPAVRDGSGTWTWEELSRAAHTAAGHLTAHGVVPGRRVLSVLPPGRAFVALLFGAARVGASLVPAGATVSAYELAWLLEDSAPVLMAAPDTYDRTARPPVPVLHETELLGCLPPAAAPGTDRTGPAPDDEALLLYTSGSTGRPKGIVCPHRAVVFAARAVAERLGYRPQDVVWNRLPMSFDYGLYQVFLCALTGAQVVFPAGEMSAGELVAVRAAGATVVPLVPTLGALLSRVALRDRRPTAVRMFTNTGAALVGADAERLRAAFPQASLVCMYGMSECKRITIADPDEDLGHPGTVGRALPGTRVFVVDQHGRPVPPGTVGQIVSAGPHVMAGYWKAPEATAQRFAAAPDGVGRAVFTGDQGRLDEDGRLYFVGRDDDVFKRRGWRMSTQELETAMLDVPGVRQAAAVRPGPDGLLTVWAVTGRTEREVLRGVAGRLGPAKTPDRCVVVDALPLTANGKVDKAVLRESLGTGR
ncbi:class I adenylate-forming enzyme family protein [Streptomyces sp. NPDC004457]|uniref:class I adenylate-forming enzyme family protein n=1 Tax=Streptomyces spinosus TaxID=2872623 RepID=UPI001CEC3A70|nr:class I adenylate-forming enzyme family protein [Streptomyces spinosus]